MSHKAEHTEDDEACEHTSAAVYDWHYHGIPLDKQEKKNNTYSAASYNQDYLTGETPVYIISQG